MGIKVKLTFFTPQVVKAMKDGAFNKVIEAVNEVRNETLVTLSGSRGGRIYTVMAGSVSKSQAQVVKSAESYQIKPSTISVGGKRRRVYTASAEGEAPAVLTGRLRQSIAASVDIEGRKIVGRVGTDVDYGLGLEFGTRKVKPRPWLKKSFEKAEGKVKDILGEKWFR